MRKINYSNKLLTKQKQAACLLESIQDTRISIASFVPTIVSDGRNSYVTMDVRLQMPCDVYDKNIHPFTADGTWNILEE